MMNRDEELKKLAELKNEGKLTQDEFNRKKEALLAASPGASQEEKRYTGTGAGEQTQSQPSGQEAPSASQQTGAQQQDGFGGPQPGGPQGEPQTPGGSQTQGQPDGQQHYSQQTQGQPGGQQTYDHQQAGQGQYGQYNQGYGQQQYGQQAYGQQYQQGYGQQGYGQPYGPQGYQAPPGYEQKSKIAAGLLGIFLGGIGIHRFYLGYTGLGVAQIAVSIVTCGIGSLWGFIEGILILCGSTITQDVNGIPFKD
jgi:TM2 domain-containing membrane protein YozV